MNLTLDMFYNSNNIIDSLNNKPIYYLKPEYEENVIDYIFNDQLLKEAFYNKPLLDQIYLTGFYSRELKDNEIIDLNILTNEEILNHWNETISLDLVDAILTTTNNLLLGVIKSNTIFGIGKKTMFNTISRTSDDNNGAGYKEGHYYDAKNLGILLYTPQLFESKTLYKNHSFSLLTEINIPEGIDAIGINAFYFCKKLKSVKLPNTIKEIKSQAFFSCSNLENINLPESIQILGYACFSGCKKLKNISLPKNLDILERRAFCACESLKEITIPNNITIIKDSLFILCSGLETINLPNNLIGIERYAFYDCTNLNNVVFPESLKYVEEDAFKNCTNLKNVIMANNIEKIGFGAFPYYTKGVIYPHKK